MIVAKAYVDQLERAGFISAARIATLRAAIDGNKTAQLKAAAGMLEANLDKAPTPKDAERMKALAAILK
jgi:hypothetical protein